MVLVIPPPVIVMIPVLSDVTVFAAAFKASVLLPDPLDGETVNHDVALLEAVHDTLEVTEMEVLAAEEEGAHEVCDTSSDAGAVVEPACVTVIVLVIAPPVTVIVPVLAKPVLALTASAIEPFPVEPTTTKPNQESLLETVHEVFDFTGTSVATEDAEGAHEDIANSSVAEPEDAAACVTFIVLVIPPPVTVIVPVLLFVAVFAVTLSVSVPLFVPLAGETVSQDWALLDAVHETLEVRAMEVLAADEEGAQDVEETSRDD